MVDDSSVLPDFQARLKISSGIVVFKIWALGLRVSKLSVRFLRNSTREVAIFGALGFVGLQRRAQRFWNTLSFLSLVFFVDFLGKFFKQRISLLTSVFSLSSPRILWVRQRQKSLDNFEVFPDKIQKIKEKKDKVFFVRNFGTQFDGAGTTPIPIK